MKVKKKTSFIKYSIALFVIFIGCGSGGGETLDTISESNTETVLENMDSSIIQDNNEQVVTSLISFEANDGRLLGSQCAQCHGTNGVSVNDWDSIAGEDDLEEEIYESGSSIMNAQAHGYTTEEIKLISNWLKSLPKND